MAKICATDVSLLGEHGEAVTLKKGTVVPDWALEQITNESAIVDGEPADASASETESSSEAEVVDYSKWHVPELAAELEKRGLDPAGKKAELVARLEDSDSA